MPETVLVPLMTWAMKWVEELSEEVLEAMDAYVSLRNRGPRSARYRTEGAPVGIGIGERRIVKLLDRYAVEGRKLPGWWNEKTGSYVVNYAHIAREADCTRDAAYRGSKALITQAVNDLGIDDGSYLQVPIRVVAPGGIQLPRFEYKDVPFYLEMLSVACYIVIAFFSGMRDAEIKSLRRGCLTLDKDSTGRVARRRVSGIAFKGEADEMGAPATWIVGDPVRKAIAALERLQDEGQLHLFAALTYRKSASARQRDAMDHRKTNSEMNRFVAWCNEYSKGKGVVDQIADDDENVWKLATSQFRRTLAWFIARRPGGSIAGAIQFRHHSVQMFEGYAGTSDSGFRAEVESEIAMARGDYLVDLESRGVELLGPAGDIARDRASKFVGRMRFAGIVADNPKQMKLLVEQEEPGVYPGEFVTCVFDASKAKCLRHRADAPEMEACLPFECRNVSLDTANVEAWLEDLNLIEGFLESGSVTAPFVLSRLRMRAGKIRELLGVTS
ncbi:hypothetical protein [Cryobacterium sp. 10C3]|nr:hypothetical protein [Cryobacterium sp. 10C3]MDY7556096.1 hypothetical protein [Cryobacterium sp. 10C3]